MSFYIRYVLTDERPVTLTELQAAIRQVDPEYEIDGDVIRLGKTGYGIIDLTQRGDPICDGDLDLLSRLAEKKTHRREILSAVQNAKAMLCVQPLNSLEPRTSEALAPLWEWLFVNRAGLLVWEGGQFSSHAGQFD